MICRCNILSAVTLIDAALELADNFASLFSVRTLLKIYNFDFFSSIFTYILIIETGFFLIILLRSHSLDLQQTNIPNTNKVFPIIANQPELIIHINHIDNELVNQQVDKQQPQKTTNNLPNDFQIVRGKRIRYPTLYQFNSRCQLRRDSESIPTEQSEEKAMFSTRLALQQQPITILELNQDMAEDTPISILKTNLNGMLNKKKQLNEDNNFIENHIQLDTNHEQRDSKSNLSIKYSHIGEVQKKIPESVHKVETPIHQEWHQNEHKSFINELNLQHIPLFIGFLQYIKHYHKLLSIIYRFDQQNPRISRATLLYVSILGQMAILTFFGKIMSLNTILALSILQSVFGFIYKTLIFYSIKSKIKIFNYFGFNLALISFCLFYFIILASISEYQSQDQSNFWGYAYISNFFLDLVIYALLMQTVYFALFVKYGTKPFIKKIGKILLPGEEYEFFYGEQVENDLVDRTEIH